MGKPVVLIACMVVFWMGVCCNGEDIKQEFLEAHNEARKAEGEEPMTWDAELEAYAQNYAKERAADCALQHSDCQKVQYGENIAAGPGPLTPKTAVEMWVAEKKHYDYATNTCKAPAGEFCGHYTQVVWKTSVKVGCAIVECANNAGHFATCNYSPPGNFVGEKPF